MCALLLVLYVATVEADALNKRLAEHSSKAAVFVRLSSSRNNGFTCDDGYRRKLVTLLHSLLWDKWNDCEFIPLIDPKTPKSTTKPLKLKSA